MIGVQLPKVVIEFLLERHPKELSLISFFGHTELWDDGMQTEFEAWAKRKEQNDDSTC